MYHDLYKMMCKQSYISYIFFIYVYILLDIDKRGYELLIRQFFQLVLTGCRFQVNFLKL